MDLKVQNCRSYPGVSIGMTNVSVCLLGCPLVPGEGPGRRAGHLSLGPRDSQLSTLVTVFRTTVNSIQCC